MNMTDYMEECKKFCDKPHKAYVHLQIDDTGNVQMVMGGAFPVLCLMINKMLESICKKHDMDYYDFMAYLAQAKSMWDKREGNDG